MAPEIWMERPSLFQVLEQILHFDLSQKPRSDTITCFLLNQINHFLLLHNTPVLFTLLLFAKKKNSGKSPSLWVAHLRLTGATTKSLFLGLPHMNQHTVLILSPPRHINLYPDARLIINNN